MKKRVLLLAALGMAAMTGTVSAQSRGYEGLWFGVHQSIGRTEWNPQGTTEAYTTPEYTITSGSINYMIAETSRAVAGFTFAFDPMSAKVAEAGGTGGHVKQTHHFSFALEPGYLMLSRLMLYGKIAYHSARFEKNMNGAQHTEAHNGLGLGIGLKLALINNFMLLSAEYQHIEYESIQWDALGSSMSYKPKTDTVMAGIHIQF